MTKRFYRSKRSCKDIKECEENIIYETGDGKKNFGINKECISFNEM
ncbi:hypothetical protein [Clostridioides difficile]|nr:hypothetical protein [Clostridioides difficile]